MARAHGGALCGNPDDDAAPITLLYVRVEGSRAACRELERGLHTIVERYAPMVELRSLTPGELPDELAGFAGRTPAVLVLRRGEVVGEAMGELLPFRELDDVVRCAVEWPA